MFLDIEDGVSIGYGVHLQPFEIRDGWMRLDHIQLERNSFLGTNSVVLAGAKIGDSASVAEQSLVPQDHDIPAHEHWGGSPMKRLEEVPSVLLAMASRADDRPWTFSLVLGFCFGALLLTLLSALAFVPSVVLVAEVTYQAGLAWGIASTVLAGPLFTLVTCILVLLGKRTVMFSAQPGIYPLRSWFGLRKWLSDQLMALSLGLTNTLYATLYLVPFLRLLGARIGAWSEVSTVAYLDPDMLHLGNGSFVADIAVVGPAVFYRNCVALIPASVGERSFVGNGALIPGGSRLGSNSLIGVYSVPPAHEVASDTSWLGSPAIFLPKRQESEQFSDKLTYHPAPSRIAGRLFIEYFRITLPMSILSCLSLLDEQVMYYLFETTSPLVLLALIPFLLMGLGIALTLLVVLLKWIIIGRYRPRVKPLWSMFVRRSELITGLYEAGAVPALLSFLTGTPWIAPFLRLLGARIGQRVWLDTTFLTEFDLVTIGDDASVGETTSLQTHLFEDRVMKMSTVKIGARCSIGSHSVVLYDAEIGAGTSLDSLSLVMKGEKLPEESYWRGIPARKSKL
jgi:non-ribosomal peptide synthetase-like protein